MARLGAGVRKRADGTLEKRFTVNGKRYSVYGKNSKEISEKEQELRRDLENNTYIDNKNITLDKYFEYWQQEREKITKSSSLRIYKSRYNNHISPILGGRKVQAIERREVIALQNSLISAGATVTTANNVVITLKNILNDAIRDEIITSNPAANIRPIKEDKEKASETIHRALTEEEQSLFMEEMKKSFYYELIALLISSGMRSGEAAALTWSDIDYINNVIHINKTVSFDKNNNMIINTPKSKAGVRDIPITANIRTILKQQREKTTLLNGNVISMDNRVFCTVYGHIITNTRVNEAINEALKSLNEQGHTIEPFTAHALRDTFATRYIEQGGTPQTLKTILGHTSLSMTMDLYAHVLPNTKQEEMKKINIVI